MDRREFLKGAAMTVGAAVIGKAKPGVADAVVVSGGLRPEDTMSGYLLLKRQSVYVNTMRSIVWKRK